jgi:hypothetical protein
VGWSAVDTNKLEKTIEMHSQLPVATFVIRTLSGGGHCGVTRTARANTVSRESDKIRRSLRLVVLTEDIWFNAVEELVGLAVVVQKIVDVLVLGVGWFGLFVSVQTPQLGIESAAPVHHEATFRQMDSTDAVQTRRKQRRYTIYQRHKAMPIKATAHCSAKVEQSAGPARHD